MGKKPRKRNEENGPDMEGLIIAFLYRFVQIISVHEEQEKQPPVPLIPPSHERLNKILQSLFDIPEICVIANTTLDRIDSTSTLQCVRFTIRILDEAATAYSRLLQSQGETDPFKDLFPMERAEEVLDIWGYKYRISDFTILYRMKLWAYMKMIVEGETETITKELDTMIEDIFSPEELTRTLQIMRLSIIGYFDQTVLNEFEVAVVEIKQKMDAIPEIRASVEMIERNREWGGNPEDVGFELMWNSLRLTIVKRMKRNNLSIPGPRKKYRWDEEEAFIQEMIFEELNNRLANNPIKLFQDALGGKLSGSLIVTVKHDLLDQVRYHKAQKRDYRRLDSLQFLEENGPALRTTNESVLETIIAQERWQEITSLLDDRERSILQLDHIGHTQAKIASELKITQQMVSKTLKKAFGKIGEYYRNM
ncbi:MAG: sigma-70 family RNA polymerase sigma factor [Planctomycetes bacterium]|nr:sigma-70 family RNA polymerase sigma factor [Planctomycetota bacterium]